MQKRHCLCLTLLIVFAGIFSSCKKEEDVSIEDLRKNNIAGSWKVKDLTLAYAVKFGGQSLPVGFSLFNLADMLPVSGPKIKCVKEASYSFTPNFSYNISGCTDLVFPGAGESGSWSLALNGGILKLGATPYTTTAMTEKSWTLTNTILILEADPGKGGALVPINITLEK